MEFVNCDCVICFRLGTYCYPFANATAHFQFLSFFRGLLIFVDDGFEYSDLNKEAITKNINELLKLNVKLYFIVVRSVKKDIMGIFGDLKKGKDIYYVDALTNLENPKYQEPIANGIRKDLQGMNFMKILEFIHQLNKPVAMGWHGAETVTPGQ